MTNKKKNQVIATNEILGATLTAKMSKSDVLAFGKDPRSFIASSLNADMGDISLSMVENGADIVNLALPYYSDLDFSSARALSDDSVGSVSGGEVVIAIASIVTAVGLTAVGGLAIGAGVAGAADANAKIGLNLDGSEK